MDQRLSSHPTEEVLEEFVLDRLAGPLAAQVEEHLLICPQCQDSVAEVDQFVCSLKAYKELDSRRTRSGWRDALFVLPRFAMMKTSAVPALALAVLVLTMLRPAPPAASPPVSVNLSSLRGGSDLFSPAPAGKPLRLSIDAAGISPERGPFQVQIVDAAGNQIWKGPATPPAAPRKDKLTALLPKPLLRGVYWVRLYAGNSELLQEFGIAVK